MTETLPLGRTAPPAGAVRTLAASRVLRLLFGLYVLAALLDASAKALATSNSFSRVVPAHFPGRAAYLAWAARRPAGNFEIFRAASHRLVEGRDLYALDPGALQDRFKYSPTFALLFAPLAWLPWPVALVLWSLVNALLLFVAVVRLFPDRRATLALACLLPEVVRSMQNAQSNALVAALIILVYLQVERDRPWRAATATMLGACIKIFPLAALAFAVPRKMVLRTVGAAAVIAAVLAVAPLVVTSPIVLLDQYRSWAATESVDAHQRWFSVMELLHQWFGLDWPNWPVQLAGTAVLLAPLAVRRGGRADEAFRSLFLCSVLLYVTLFNHQAERSSYLIAFTGATLWFTTERRTRPETILYAIALVAIPLMSTVIPTSATLRSPTVTLYRLAVPSVAIWLLIQVQLLRWPHDGSAAR